MHCRSHRAESRPEERPFFRLETQVPAFPGEEGWTLGPKPQQSCWNSKEAALAHLTKQVRIRAKFQQDLIPQLSIALSVIFLPCFSQCWLPPTVASLLFFSEGCWQLLGFLVWKETGSVSDPDSSAEVLRLLFCSTNLVHESIPERLTTSRGKETWISWAYVLPFVPKTKSSTIWDGGRAQHPC